MLEKTLPNDQLPSPQRQSITLNQTGIVDHHSITSMRKMPPVPTAELLAARKWRRRAPHFWDSAASTSVNDRLAGIVIEVSQGIAKAPPLSKTELKQALKEKPPGASSLGHKAATAFLAGTLVLGAVGETNHIVTESLWPQTQTQIVEINQDTPPGLEHSGILVFAGLGEPDSIKQSEALKPSLEKKFGHVFAIVYQNDGIDENELAQSVNDSISQYHLKILSLYGLSTGSVIETHMLPKLDLAANGGVKLADIIEESPPVTPDTIRNRNGNYIPAELLYKLGIHDAGGFLGKLIGEAYTYIYHNTDPEVDLKFQIANTMNHTLDSESPPLWGSQMHEAAANSKDEMVKDFASVHGYRLYLIRAKNPAADPTVDVQRAEQELEEINRKVANMRGGNRRGSSIGNPTTITPLIVIALPITHADPIQQPDVHNEAIKNQITS